jgi:putative Mn2+ efflux pump MntP
MNALSTILLALAMSTDAFAAAVGKGTALHEPRFAEALRTGAIFGAIEAATPLVGWALGHAAVEWVQSWDHWIAFVLLGGLGAKMVVESFAPADADGDSERSSRHSFWSLALTGVATSIDALAIGVGLAFIHVSILPVAAAIGCTTFVAVTAGVMLGRVLGAAVGQRAELLGGLILIGVGATILVEHLAAAG